MNIYAYVGNNPINYIDPWGLDAVKGDGDGGPGCGGDGLGDQLVQGPEGLDEFYDDINKLHRWATLKNMDAPLYLPWFNDCAPQATRLASSIVVEIQEYPATIDLEIVTRSRRPGGPDVLWNKFIGNHTVIVISPKNEYKILGAENYVLDPWIGPLDSLSWMVGGDPVEARKVDLFLEKDFINEYPYDVNGNR